MMVFIDSKIVMTAFSSEDCVQETQTLDTHSLSACDGRTRIVVGEIYCNRNAFILTPRSVVSN
jgi:hypothetical protein